MQMDFHAPGFGSRLQRCVDSRLGATGDPHQTGCRGKSCAKVKEASASTHLSLGPRNPALRGRTL